MYIYIYIYIYMDMIMIIINISSLLSLSLLFTALQAIDKAGSAKAAPIDRTQLYLRA